jgi:hypothetical protein
MSSRPQSSVAATEPPDFNTATLNLYRISGVAGLLFQKGQNMLANHMPFSDQRTVELGGVILKMCKGYAAVRRHVRLVLVAYDAGSLLIVIHEEAQLALLLTARAEMDVVASAATVFMAEQAERLEFVSSERQTNELRDPLAPKEMVVTGSQAASRGARLLAEQPKPEISRWQEVRKAVERTLSKVMGRAQVANLIERVSREKGLPDLFQLTTERGKELAVQVIEQVPNRSKRASLLTELGHAFEELKL